MVTGKQLAANRRNALKSTGPRSAAGKDVASKNALKHGLLSSQPVMDDESQNAVLPNEPICGRNGGQTGLNKISLVRVSLYC